MRSRTAAAAASLPRTVAPAPATYGRVDHIAMVVLATVGCLLLLAPQTRLLEHPPTPLYNRGAMHHLRYGMALWPRARHLGAPSARALSLGPPHLGCGVPTPPLQYLSPGRGAL